MTFNHNHALDAPTPRVRPRPSRNLRSLFDCIPLLASAAYMPSAYSPDASLAHLRAALPALSSPHTSVPSSPCTSYTPPCPNTPAFFAVLVPNSLHVSSCIPASTYASHISPPTVLLTSLHLTLTFSPLARSRVPFAFTFSHIFTWSLSIPMTIEHRHPRTAALACCICMSWLVGPAAAELGHRYRWCCGDYEICMDVFCRAPTHTCIIARTLLRLATLGLGPGLLL